MIAIFLALANMCSAAASTNIEPALVIQAATSIAAMTDRRFVFGQNRGHVFAWNALTGDLVADAPGEGGAFEPRAEIAILGAEVWDLHGKTRLIDTGLSARNAVASGFTRNGRFAVIGAPKIQIWDIKKKELVGTIETKTGNPSFLAVSDGGDYIAVGRGPQFDIYEIARDHLIQTGALAAVWPFRAMPAKGFSTFVNDRSTDFTVIYERPERGGGAQHRPLWRIDWKTGAANVFADYLPESGLSARARGTVVDVSWAVEGSTLAVLIGHQAPVRRIAFSPDHWSMATGDKSGDVRVWDAYSGELRYRCLGGTGEIVSLSFSPDAQFLLAASRSEIRIYSLTP
jgi:WD40 repeat protein